MARGSRAAGETVARRTPRAVSVTVSIEGDQTLRVGSAQSIAVGAAQSLAVGASRSTQVGADDRTSIGGTQSVTVGNSRSVAVGADDELVAGKNLALSAGGTLLLRAEKELVIQVGTASIVLKANGDIQSKGKKVTIQVGEDLSTTMLLRCTAAASGRRARLIPAPVGLLWAAAGLAGRRGVAERVLGSLQVDIAHARTRLAWSPPLRPTRRCGRPSSISGHLPSDLLSCLAAAPGGCGGRDS